VEAKRNSAVSTPSRATPTKATEASAMPPPIRSDSLTWARSWPPIVAACFRIQKAIQVTTPAATIIAVPSYRVSESPSSSPAERNRMPPIATLVAAPAATPIQTERPCSDAAPVLAR
jgi:hypothetical protein